MTTHELQQEILRLKKEKNVCILAHAYQSQAVLEVADYTGDSYGLSVQAAKTDAAGVIMCGLWPRPARSSARKRPSGWQTRWPAARWPSSWTCPRCGR